MSLFHAALENPVDLTIHRWLGQFAGHHPILDFVMSFFAQYALEIYAVLFIIAWFTVPRTSTNRRHALIVSGCAGILALFFNLAISHIWYRSRPFAALPNVTALIPHAADASFPSDHASGSFGFAFGIHGTKQKWVSYAFTTVAVIVMIARVYTGVHWATDVMASLVVGMIAGKLVRKYSRFLYSITRSLLALFKLGSYEHKNVGLGSVK